MAELNPVTLDDFNGRMAKHEAQMKTINGEIKEPTGYCVACTKNFGTQKALENHKQSKKHMVTSSVELLQNNETLYAYEHLKLFYRQTQSFKEDF